MVQTLNSHNNNSKQNNSNITYTMNDRNTEEIFDNRTIQPISNNRKEGYTMEFANRQKEYENMMKRDLPPEPNFKEGDEDKAIENMEELLQQQMRQRELDIQPIGGLPPPPRPKSKRVKFIETLDLSNGSIDIDMIPLFNTATDTVTKQDLINLQEKFDNLNEKIDTLHEKFDDFYDKITELKN